MKRPQATDYRFCTTSQTILWPVAGNLSSLHYRSDEALAHRLVTANTNDFVGAGLRVMQSP